MMKIVFLDTNTIGDDISLDKLKEFGELKLYQSTTSEQVDERIAGYDVVIVNKVQIRKANIDASASLKLICVTATGINNIDFEYAESKNIPVRNVANYSTESVAQVTFMFMLNLVGKANYFDTYVKSGDYSKSGNFTNVSNPFFELKGKKLGIIAMGNIGLRVASIAKAFGMEVAYFSTSGTSHCKEYPSLSLEELLSTSDIVSIHAPLNERTLNLINIDNLKLMKRSGFIINIGRGGIINESDLVEALNSDYLAGAAIDVFEKEPIAANHPYLEKIKDPSKLILAPHIGWTSIEARTLLIDKLVENIAKEAPLQNPVY